MRRTKDWTLSSCTLCISWPKRHLGRGDMEGSAESKQSARISKLLWQSTRMHQDDRTQIRIPKNQGIPEPGVYLRKPQESRAFTHEDDQNSFRRKNRYLCKPPRTHRGKKRREHQETYEDTEKTV